MKRRNWLIATVAAVFVLQAPLCVFACIPGSGSDAEMAAGEHEMPSCHEQAPAASDTPNQPAESHDECGCESSYSAVLVSPDQTLSNAQNIVALPPRVLATPLAQLSTRTSTVWANKTDLPPPNILLLKSTLLI
ncbi:MAG: hypothetical protein NXI30_15915 [bacterium]|nr:hypothetical protein [bacterium]